jgi:hypothetical protein
MFNQSNQGFELNSGIFGVLPSNMIVQRCFKLVDIVAVSAEHFGIICVVFRA